MKLKVKKLYQGAMIPTYATEGASGMDLHLCVEEGPNLRLDPGDDVCLHTGIAVEIPEGYEGQIRPRSSLSRYGIVSLFCTIDSDYRGELMVILVNLSKYPFSMRNGDRIAQLVVAPVQRCEIEEVSTLSETKRGSGGFGSTGR